MLLGHKETGEFYTQEVLHVLDVCANHLSAPILDKSESLESLIARSFRLRRGDEFQLVKMIENREKTYRSICGSDGQVWSESYKVHGREMKIIRTIKWTGKKFVEVK